ncbi:MAG: phosphomannomutase/phosphoglucomutase [Deltaproteobacteria bacterium]|nr:phosphomannomutase/phosphoglucomutase [Deltaproteobacteria bacterium]
MTNVSGAIFREYDIRGEYGKDLTPETAELIGRAYAVYVRKTGLLKDPITVSVGRDVRLSSGALRDALIKGLAESGVNCIDIGECPTPLQYFSMHMLDVDGGVMITGSHNPPEYNGFKVSIGKETIHGREIQRLKDVINNEVIGKPAPDADTGNVETFDIVTRYVDYVAGKFKLPKLQRPVKVAIDCGNGTAGPVAPQLLKRLGCDVVELFSAPDGRFPNHHPDPTVEKNLAALIDAVKKEKADFGIAYDGDADRIGAVDENGGVIWGDKLMLLFAKDILETTPGAVIVGEVKSSQVMYDEIKKSGGVPVMWKTGHSLIKAKMKEVKAALAGEMSGHIFFADRWFGFDDAIYSSCRAVEILARKRAADPAFKFSALLSGIPRTCATPEIRVDCPDNLKFQAIEKLSAAIGGGTEEFKIKDIIRIDGLRVNFEGGWALVRASNTQPVLVMRFEASDEALISKAKAFMKDCMKKACPEIEAGF